MQNKVKISAFAVLASSVLFSQVVSAEEFQLDQVTVTATRIQKKVSEVPGDVTVITKEQIEQKGARTLADALQGIAGVSVNSVGAKGEISVPYIFGSDRVVVLVDGKRFNLPQGPSRGHVGVDLNQFLIANHVERIEIVRGGGSALYGPDAVGGVINIITKQGQGKMTTTVDTAIGKHHERQYSLVNQGSEGTLRWYVAGSEDSADGELPRSDYKLKGVTVKIDKEIAKNKTLSAAFDYFGNYANNPRFDKTMPEFPNYGNTLRHNWGLTYQHSQGGAQQSVRLYQHNQRYSGKNVDFDPNTWLPFSAAFDHSNKVSGMEYQNTDRLNEQHLLTIGTEWRREQVNSSKYVQNRERISKALFLQDEIRLSQQMIAHLGLRYDDNTVYGSHWLPKVSLTYQKNHNTSYFANWGKVFKAPNFDDLYANYPGMGTGDPNLKAETGWTSELGIKKRVGANHEVTMTLFKRQLKDAIRWIYDPNAFTYQSYNVDNYTTTGINAAVESRLSEKTSAGFGYTYIDSHILDSQAGTVKQDGTPYHTVTANVMTRSGRWKHTVYGTLVSKAGGKTSEVPGYFTANTMSTYQFSENQQGYLGVQNLFDRKYLVLRDSIFGEYVAPSRNIVIGFKQSF